MTPTTLEDTVQLSAVPASVHRREVSASAAGSTTAARPGPAAAAGRLGTASRTDGPKEPGRGRARLRRFGLGLAGVVGVIALLELVVRTGLLPETWFPPPSQIFPAFAGLVADGELFGPVGQTLQGWVLGILAAAVVALPLGIAIGSVELAHRLTRFLLEFLRPIPPVALIPAAVLIFGSNLDMKVFLIAFGVFWPILLQTVYGIHDTDPTLRDTARSYGLPRHARLLRIVLPSALPYIATGLRIASAIGLILAITAELVVGTPGIGVSITDAQSAGDAQDVMYAWILAAGLLGFLLNGSLQAVERRILHWHTSFRGGNR
ncbi:ABC transporter permease [Blastococcus atacamensis]|uniref:ABC transporter permease n=1 Tax=Blastococcus atacamensis TaxID=2070508 RepID=UPI0012FFFFB3|nr:ABC transporter permease [Blastococcus atacamensis]